MTKFSIETFWANVKPRGRLAHVELGFAGGKRSLRSCEKIAEIAGLTDESVCPTLVREGLRFCGAGAFACQPIFSQLLSERLTTAASPKALWPPRAGCRAVPSPPPHRPASWLARHR